MSSTRTGGSGRASTRLGSVRCGSARQVSGRGVAEPASSARAGAAGALGGDEPGVVARVALVLVGRVVLLVDHDQPEVGDRREHGRARADGDPRLAGAQPPPLVVALALAERRVQQRHRVAEARLEARDGLRRERDLRHEHDHAAPARERVGAARR